MIAEYLTDDPVTVGETLWQNVYRLPPAHALEIAATGATTRRYWDFDPDARIEHARDADYEEHFAHLFKEAVACRLDGMEGVGVFLSGGIDSSSIAGLAQTMPVEANRPELFAPSRSRFPGGPATRPPLVAPSSTSGDCRLDLVSTRASGSRTCRGLVSAGISTSRRTPTV